MAAKTNDQTLDRTLRQVLAQANAEQNQYYPPNVFDTHYNAVTSFILTEGVKVFGENQYIKDLLRPYLKQVLLPVKFGKAELPDDYRHYAGASIFVKKDFKECMVIDGLDPDKAPTKEQLMDAQEKSKAISWDVDMVEEDEYSDITNHSYKTPTFEFPIGCIFESDFIKVCPYDIPFIELHYIRQPKIYRYGYGVNTDDSYYYDPAMPGAVETEWRTNADDLLFKAMNTLYAMYVRDGELGNAMAVLKKEGLF
jgi:hypothetical protein